MADETYLERIERLVDFEGWPKDVAELHVHHLAILNRQELWQVIRAAHQDEEYD